MEIVQLRALPYLLALFLVTEYGIKQWLESNKHILTNRPGTNYAVFRIAHFTANLLGGTLLVGLDVNLWSMLIVVEILALTEIPLGAFEQQIQQHFHISLRWVHLLPLAALVIWAMTQGQDWMLSLPASGIVHDIINAFSPTTETPDLLPIYLLGYTFLGYPANHLIRCLVDKASSGFVVDIVFDRREAPAAHGLSQPELASVREDFGPTAPPSTPTLSATFSSDAAALRAGRTIGILERWIIVSLTASNQFALIGLVLTAKSIARFKQLEHDREFAEYYLLGTLYSTLIALIVGMGLRYV